MVALILPNALEWEVLIGVAIGVDTVGGFSSLVEPTVLCRVGGKIGIQRRRHPLVLNEVAKVFLL